MKRKKIVAWLLVMCMCLGVVPNSVLTVKAATDEASVATITKPTTGIVNPPVVATRVTKDNYSKLSGSAVAIMHIDTDLNVVDGETIIGTVAEFMETYGETVVPAFYFDVKDEMYAICDYLKTNNVTDAFYVTHEKNVAWLSPARSLWSYARAIVEYDSLGDVTARAAMRREMIQYHASIAIVPANELTVEITAEYNVRCLSVWADVATETAVYSGIANGYNGMIAKSPDTIIDVYESITVPTLSGKPIVIGHQGTNQTGYAQNTLQAFQASMETQGVMGFECDANYKTSDGHILIMHDASIKRTTTYDGDLNIADMTLEEVRQYTIDATTASQGTEIPVLEDLFKNAATMYPNAVIYLETQYSFRTEILELIEKYQLEDNVVIFCRGSKNFWGTVPVIGGATRAINMVEAGYSQTETGAVSYMIDKLSTYNMQQIPTTSTIDDTLSYGYDCISTEDTLTYSMAARGFLLYQSSTPTEADLDRFLITGMGSTGLLADYTNYTKDYGYSIEAEDVELKAGEALNLEKTIKQNYGTTVQKCGVIKLDGDELVASGYSYTMNQKGSATIVYYTDIIQDNLEYRIYSEPVTATWKKESLPSDFTQVTPRDFGIADFTDNSGTKYEDSVLPIESADEVVLHARVKFGRSVQINYLHNSAIGAGIRLLANQNMYLYNYLSPSGSSGIYVGGTFENGEYVGGELVEGRAPYTIRASLISKTENFDTLECNLSISTEFVDFDGDGSENDLKVGIWFNEKLYNETYLYMRNCLDVTTVHLDMSVISALSPFVTAQSMPAGYTVVTPMTYGVSDAANTDGVSAVTPDTDIVNVSIDKTLFSAQVKYKGNSYLDYLYYNRTGSGIRLQYFPNTAPGVIRLVHYMELNNVMYKGGSFVNSEYQKDDLEPVARGKYFELSSKTALVGNTFKNVEFLIWITTEFVDFDGDGSADDLQLGIWFNGVLYDDSYFYVLDCKDITYKGKVNCYYLTEIASPWMELNHMGIVGGEYTSAEDEFYTSEFVANKLMDGTTLHSGVRFEGEGATLYYGCSTDNSEKAVKITSNSEGLLVSHTYGTEEVELVQMNISNVGIDVLNNNFDLKLSTDVVDSDGDGSADDVKLGIWVNDKYSSFYIVDAADVMTAKIGIKCAGESSILLGELAKDSPDAIDHCLDDGAYTKTKTETMTRLSVDGVSQDADVTLEVPGTYSVVSTENSLVYMEDVTVYRTNDVNADNVVDSKDLVRMLKVSDADLHEQTVAGLTLAGKKAVGYKDGQIWTATSAKYMMNVMRGAMVGLEAYELVGNYVVYTDFESGNIDYSGNASSNSMLPIRSASYIDINNFIDASIDDSVNEETGENKYDMIWYAYRRDHALLKRYSADLTSFTKADVLEIAPQAAYIKILIWENKDEKLYPEQQAEYGLEVRVRNLPGSREAAVTAVDVSQLSQFADENGAYKNDFTIVLSLDDMEFLKDIWILSSNAKYETATGAQPTIQYELVNSATGKVLYYAFPYVIGGDGVFVQREWRVPGLDPGANAECQDMGIGESPYDTVRISFVIPEGVTLYLNELSNEENYLNTEDANNGVKFISHTGLYGYAPTNTTLAFEMAGQMGYRSMVTIVKFTKDGVPICFHDDINIRMLLTYKDGTSIPNDNYEGSEIPEEERVDVAISNYTYEEITTMFSAGYRKDPMYKNLNVPTLEEYFDICVKYKMEPQFSVHPSLTVEQWEIVKQMMIEQSTDEWNLLENFYVKTAGSTDLQCTQQIFGRGIGGYILLVPNGASANYDLYGMAKRAGFVKEDNLEEVDFDGYNLSVAFFQQSTTLEAGIAQAMAAGFERIDIYGGLGMSGQEFTQWINKGVRHFCVDYHTSVGLNW